MPSPTIHLQSMSCNIQDGRWIGHIYEGSWLHWIADYRFDAVYSCCVMLLARLISVSFCLQHNILIIYFRFLSLTTLAIVINASMVLKDFHIREVAFSPISKFWSIFVLLYPFSSKLVNEINTRRALSDYSYSWF